MRKYFFFFLISFCPIIALGQNLNFHKVYTLPFQAAVKLNTVYVSDSNYYFSGHVDGAFGHGLVYLKSNLSGEILDTVYNIDSNYNDLAGFSCTKLDTNNNGHFMLHYTKRPENQPGMWFHERVEMNTEGVILFKNSLDTFIQEKMDGYDRSRLILDNENDCYYTLSQYIIFNENDTINPSPNEDGFAICKFRQDNHELVWMKKKYSFWSPSFTPKIQRNLMLYQNGDILLIYFTFDDVYSAPLSQRYGKIFIERFDSNGNLLFQKIVQPTTMTLASFGSAFTINNKELIMWSTDSEPIYVNPGWDYWGIDPQIIKLDSNFNLVWAKKLGGIQYSLGNIQQNRMIDDFEIINDTALISAYFLVENDSMQVPTITNLRIENRKVSDGVPNWIRNYKYFTQYSFNQDPTYQIEDVEGANDGGFIFIGQSINYDSLNEGKPGYLGYVLKTNCLGFLGDPTANFTSIRDTSFGANFTNTSLMGGSYLWDFGDGTTLATGENIGFDSTQPLFHQYSDTGNYNVSLIAYGCNGANDTLRYTMHITPEQIINPNVTNYMALGPNPVKSGESISVYVGNLPSENCLLSFYDYQGKLVSQNKLPQSKSTYIIPLSFAAGTYQAVLRNGNDELEVEKVVVL